MEALNFVREAAEQIAKMREEIDILWSEKWVSTIKGLCDKIGALESMPRCTSFQRNRANTPADSPEEYYKRSLVIPFLDELSAQLKSRFTADDDAHVASLFKLLPAIIKEVNDFKDLEQNLLFWEVDLPSPHGLLNELKMWRRKWEECSTAEPASLLCCIAEADEDVFSNIRQLLLIACTLPVTSCEAERSFSALKRLKGSARSRMLDSRLAGLALMNVHYKTALKVDVNSIIKTFVQLHPRKLFCNSIIFD